MCEVIGENHWPTTSIQNKHLMIKQVLHQSVNSLFGSGWWLRP
jgi:hypothetical protein